MTYIGIRPVDPTLLKIVEYIILMFDIKFFHYLEGMLRVSDFEIEILVLNKQRKAGKTEGKYQFRLYQGDVNSSEIEISFYQ